MTVQELIDKLQEIKDKTIPITVAKTTYAMGSSWTGMYAAGSEPVEITNIGFFAGDKLAGINELDEVDHVEIAINDNY